MPMAGQASHNMPMNARILLSNEHASQQRKAGRPETRGDLRPAGVPSAATGQPVTVVAPVSMWPVKRRDQDESVLTVMVKSYQPLQYATWLK
jgi:hypothetical protein